MSRYLQIIVCLGALCIVSGCNKRPDGVLDEKEMVDLMTDIQLANAYYNTNATNSGKLTKEVLVESVLEKHGVSHAELDSTLAYYGRNMDDYQRLFDKIEMNLKAHGTGSAVEEYDAENDIWPYNRFTAFFPHQISDGLYFSMPAEGLTPGNSLEWGLRVSTPDGVDILLGVEYENGTASYVQRNAGGNRSVKVNIQTDTSLNLKRIYGTVTAPQSSMPFWADSIRLVKAEFDSVSYTKIRSQKTLRKPVTKPLVEKMEGPLVTDTVNP